MNKKKINEALLKVSQNHSQNSAIGLRSSETKYVYLSDKIQKLTKINETRSTQLDHELTHNLLNESK